MTEQVRRRGQVEQDHARQGEGDDSMWPVRSKRCG
jgi:hypothetical protein